MLYFHGWYSTEVKYVLFEILRRSLHANTMTVAMQGEPIKVANSTRIQFPINAHHGVTHYLQYTSCIIIFPPENGWTSCEQTDRVGLYLGLHICIGMYMCARDEGEGRRLQCHTQLSPQQWLNTRHHSHTMARTIIEWNTNNYMYTKIPTLFRSYTIQEWLPT